MVLERRIYPKTKTEKSKEDRGFDFSYILTILSYIGVFILGLIFPKDLIYKLKKEENSFREKVKSAKDIKELLKILILEDREKYSKIIEKLEENIYQNENIELGDIKKELSSSSHNFIIILSSSVHLIIFFDVFFVECF